MGMTPQQILENEISDQILSLVNDYHKQYDEADGITQSDLQGIAQAIAMQAIRKAQEITKKKDQYLNEAIADIAYSAGAREVYSGDSRADVQLFISWAMEFDKIHEKTDWDEDGDYIGKIDEFATRKMREAQS